MGGDPLELITGGLFALALGYSIRHFFDHAFPKLSLSSSISVALSIALLALLCFFEKIPTDFLKYPLVVLYGGLFLQSFLWVPRDGHPTFFFYISLSIFTPLVLTYFFGLEATGLAISLFLLLVHVAALVLQDSSQPSIQRLKYLGLFIPWIFIVSLGITFTKSTDSVLFEYRDLDSHFRYTEEKNQGGLPTNRLFVNGNEKYSSQFEQHRYLCLASLPVQFQRSLGGTPKRVLILGGADGLAARNALGFSPVKEITIVDDHNVLYEKAKTEVKFRMYNLDSLRNPKTTYVRAEPFDFLHDLKAQVFDVILIDNPPGLGLPYSRYASVEFLKSIELHLEENGVAAIATPLMLENLPNLQAIPYEPNSGNYSMTMLVKSSADVTKSFESLLQGVQRFPCKKKNKGEALPAFTLSTLYKRKR